MHFQFAAPEGLGYAVNRYRREAERHYQVLNDHLAGREFIVGSGYTIADMSAWGWLDRASRVMKGAEDPLAPYPNLKRFFQASMRGRRCSEPGQLDRTTSSRRSVTTKRSEPSFRPTTRPARKGTDDQA